MASCSTAKVCTPCEEGGEVLTREDCLNKLGPLWKLKTLENKGDALCLSRSFVAKDFLKAMAFINACATLAEEQGHHPDMHLTSYREVEVVLWTHSMGGVSRNDLAMAKLIDQLPVVYSPKWEREMLQQQAS